MATKKSGGTAKNLRDSNPKYLGIKLASGALAQPGSIIVRQRGTYFRPGQNTGLGKDHTIFSLTSGKVSFKDRRKMNFDGQNQTIKVVSVV